MDGQNKSIIYIYRYLDNTKVILILYILFFGLSHFALGIVLVRIKNYIIIKKYSDLRIKIEDNIIFVQKLILKSYYNYFESKFEENQRTMREITDNKKIDDEIQVTEYSYDVYYAFLKCIYTSVARRPGMAGTVPESISLSRPKGRAIP
jgi:hypothetical protein